MPNRVKWTPKRKIELLEKFEECGSRPEVAAHFGVSVKMVEKVLAETRGLIDSGYMTRDGEMVKELPKKNPKFDLRAKLSEMGYDPASGIVTYRRILENLIQHYNDECEVKSVRMGHHDRLTNRLVTANGGNFRDEMDEMRGQLMDLWREAVELDKSMMPYVHPKLQSNSVKVEQEQPPLLIIEHPGGK